LCAAGVEQVAVQPFADQLLVVFWIGAVVGIAHSLHADVKSAGAGGQEQGQAAEQGGAGGEFGFHIFFPFGFGVGRCFRFAVFQTAILANGEGSLKCV